MLLAEGVCSPNLGEELPLYNYSMKTPKMIEKSDQEKITETDNGLMFAQTGAISMERSLKWKLLPPYMKNNLVVLLIIVYENYAFHCIRVSINVRATFT